MTSEAGEKRNFTLTTLHCHHLGGYALQRYTVTTWVAMPYNATLSPPGWLCLTTLHCHHLGGYALQRYTVTAWVAMPYNATLSPPGWLCLTTLHCHNLNEYSLQRCTVTPHLNGFVFEPRIEVLSIIVMI